MRKGAKERGLLRYAYYAGSLAAAGAVVLFVYGHVLPGAVAALLGGGLLWMAGIPVLFLPRVAHARRVQRVIRDWNGLTHAISAAAERRWEAVVAEFATLRPPAAVADAHSQALTELRRRPRREAGAAATGAFAVNARTIVRALADDANALPATTPGGVDYARELRRLWTNAAAAGNRDNAQYEVHCDGALRRIRRLKPPPAMADDHARLIELMERYCAALKQRNSATASADRAGVQAATVKLEMMRAEFKQLRPWYDDERERWYGPE